MTHSRVRHDSFTCAPLLIHLCGTQHCTRRCAHCVRLPMHIAPAAVSGATVTLYSNDYVFSHTYVFCIHTTHCARYCAHCTCLQMHIAPAAASGARATLYTLLYIYTHMITCLHTHVYTCKQCIARGVARTARVRRCTSRQQHPQMPGPHYLYIYFYIYSNTCVTHVYNTLREALRALHASVGAHRTTGSLRSSYIHDYAHHLYIHDYTHHWQPQVFIETLYTGLHIYILYRSSYVHDYIQRASYIHDYIYLHTLSYIYT